MREYPVSVTDRNLVTRAVNAESEAERSAALDAISRRYQSSVAAKCGWWLADDAAAAEAAANGTFEVAFRALAAGASGQAPLREPDKLEAWLHGIARNQCRKQWRQRHRETPFPGDDDREDAGYEEAVSRRRRDQFDRMLETVASTFTDHQRKIFQLSTQQNLRGKKLAAALGTTEKEANDATYENKDRVRDGFGALVLARDGRPYCAGLARILDEARWDGDETFTRVLRLRILRHLNDCRICDNCVKCNAKKLQLIKPYAPVLIPALIAAGLEEQVNEAIQQICAQTPVQTMPSSTQRPGTQPGTPAPTRGAGTVVSAALALIIAIILLTGDEKTSAGQPPQPRVTPVAAVQPLAYATTTAVQIRTSSGSIQRLAAVPAGTRVKRLVWAADGRRLAWLAQTTAGDSNRLFLTDLSSNDTRSWLCACSQIGYQGDRLISDGVDSAAAPALLSYPALGGTPTRIPISGLPQPTGPATFDLLSASGRPNGVIVGHSLPGGASVRGGPLRLYSVDPAGKASSLGVQTRGNAPPTRIALSSDGKLMAYIAFSQYGQCDVFDEVALVDLTTGKTTMQALPTSSRYWGASGVWFDEHHTVYATLAPYPARCDPQVMNRRVTPKVYRAEGNRMVPTEQAATQGGHVANGWQATIGGAVGQGIGQEEGPTTGGPLAVIHDGTSTTIAPNATALSWAPRP